MDSPSLRLSHWQSKCFLITKHQMIDIQCFMGYEQQVGQRHSSAISSSLTIEVPVNAGYLRAVWDWLRKKDAKLKWKKIYREKTWRRSYVQLRKRRWSKGTLQQIRRQSRGTSTTALVSLLPGRRRSSHSNNQQQWHQRRKVRCQAQFAIIAVNKGIREWLVRNANFIPIIQPQRNRKMMGIRKNQMLGIRWHPLLKPNSPTSGRPAQNLLLFKLEKSKISLHFHQTS